MTGTLATGSSAVSRSQPVATRPAVDTRILTPIQPLSVPRQLTNESITTCSSVASHDTFMTALTSTPSPNSPTTSRLNITSSHSLRKSISVDSFIKNRRSPDLSEPGPSSGIHSRDYSRETPESEAGLDLDIEEWNPRSSHAAPNGQHLHGASKSLASRLLGRARGHSLSGPSVPGYDDPYLEDSEYERTADMTRLPLLASHRPHSTSVALANGFSKGRAKARPGEALLLPPRTPTLSSASSASSLSSAANGSVFTGGVPPVPPIPQLPHRRTNVPGPLILPRRTRSGSLSQRNGGISTGGSHDEFSLAVVGSSGCGKTTVIKKGLKAWGVSDESICTVTTPRGRLQYGLRTITAPRDNGMSAHVLELDSSLLHLDSPFGAWPEGLPPIAGVLVCYDASDPASFSRVPDLLACYHALHFSAVAMACKCDLERNVSPRHASERAAPYNVGLVEVTSASDVGKRKMRHCFHWLIRAVEKSRREDIPAGSPYRNPASPDMLIAPWSDGYPLRVSTPPAGSPSRTSNLRDHSPVTVVPLPPGSTPGTSTPIPTPPSAPTSPPRVKSPSELMGEVERIRYEESRGNIMGPLGPLAGLSESLHEPLTQDEKDVECLERNILGDLKYGNIGKEPPPMPWATLEELLDKLFFVAVSGDDPTFIQHFFLTYRKFATPRSVLLGMQKRVRQLNTEHSDLLLGRYAQMRICDILEEWIETYQNDFAVPGTIGAITALVRQISLNPCTLHYGSDIVPFLDELHYLQDPDASWSIPPEDSQDESDDDGTDLLEDEAEGIQRDILRGARSSSATTAPVTDPDPAETRPKSSSITTRERKGSLPLSTRSTMSAPLTTTLSGSSEGLRSVSIKSSGGTPPRNSPRDLVKLATTLGACDPLDIAQQITKMQSELFLAIEPRQWLRYTMGDAKSEPMGEPISASANLYNQLANWVSSLILAHDRVRLRERQVERFVELAGKLRTLNNYVGLRAVMTGINNATFPNDEIMTMFRDNKIRQYQQFLGWEILLNSQHNHRAYRLALRHTAGPGIPDMEVHTFDMVRANESNPNHKLDDPSKIHWGKFTLMARMIIMLQGLQHKIMLSGEYDFPERRWIRDMLNNDVMDAETMRSRVFLPPDDAEPIFPLAQGLDSPNATRTDAARFKRLFFW